LIGGPYADKYGRKATLRLCAVLFLVGTALMALAPNYISLVAGRMVTGLGVGVAFVVAPVYISEVAPPEKRGELNTVFDVAINGGILGGYVTGYLVQVMVASNLKWRLMLGLGGVLPIMVWWLLPHLPESPRWMVLQQQDDAAAAILRQLDLSEEEIERSLVAMRGEIRASRNQSATFSKSKRLVLQLGFWQQITGTEAVLYYSADFLSHAGMQSARLRLFGNCFVGLSKLVPEYIAMQYVDNHGRRPYLIASSIALTVSTLLLSAAFHWQWSPLVVVVLLCSVMASFSSGVGPFTFLCASENLDLGERAAGMTAAAAMNRCTSGLVALTAVSISDWVGYDGLFAIYAVLGFCSLPFYARSVPETAGASLEQLASQRRRDQVAESETMEDDALNPSAAAGETTPVQAGLMA